MIKILNFIVGLIIGSLFAIGLILVLAIFFVVIIPCLFYFTVRDVLKQLTKR